MVIELKCYQCGKVFEINPPPDVRIVIGLCHDCWEAVPWNKEEGKNAEKRV